MIMNRIRVSEMNIFTENEMMTLKKIPMLKCMRIRIFFFHIVVAPYEKLLNTERNCMLARYIVFFL